MFGRKIAILAASVLLTGCASTLAHYRAEPAAISYETGKSPSETVACLAGSLEGLPTPIQSVAPQGYTLVWEGMANRRFIDVRPSGTGSTVAYHEHGVGDAGGRFASAVRACQA